MSRVRNHFTDKEEEFLIQFIAKHGFSKGRNGNQLFQRLTENAQGEWPLAANHPWQSWRNRYVKNRDWYDHKIAMYQKSNNIKPKVSVDKAATANQKQMATRLLKHDKEEEADNKSGQGGREAAGVRITTGVANEKRDHRERSYEPPDLLPKQSPLSTGHSITPQFTPVAVADDQKSVYSPPEGSRGGQFVRLVKEGRLQEALKREGRKASLGGSLSPGKTVGIGATTAFTTSVSGLDDSKEVERPSSNHQSPAKTRGITITNIDLRSPPKRPIWGPEEDDLLLAAQEGDEIALPELEKTAGKYAVRQRTAQMLILL